jgi:hypothetical protein
MSFKIKSSHKFVNQNASVKETKMPDYSDQMYLNGELDPSSMSFEDTPSHNKHVKTGSKSGMAIRPCVTAMADYY